jgi:hypothetical protein
MRAQARRNQSADGPGFPRAAAQAAKESISGSRPEGTEAENDLIAARSNSGCTKYEGV